MARVKGGTVSKTRRRKVLKQAKGYFGSKHRLYKTAQEQVFHSLSYAYRDRRQKKRDFRKLWITRINAACRENNISYSKFINGLNIAGLTINRKMLAELAVDNKEAFKDLVAISEDALKSGKKAVANEVKEEPKKEVVKKDEAPKKETKKEPVKKEETKKDYSSMTLTELKEVAKEQGVKGYSTMKKAELLKSIK